MVSVTFYNCSNDGHDVNKSNKTTIATFNCNIYDDQSVETPTLLLPNTTNLKNANYCYIADFGRYYFVWIEILADGRQVAHCDVDVLMSFWSEFNGSPCIASRSSSSNFPNMVDPKVVTTPKITREEIEVPVSTPFKTNPASLGNFKQVVVTVAGRTDLGRTD